MNERKEQVLQAFRFRQAIKEFEEDKKISDEDFEYIIETGRLSPSSFGWEPWQFLVVQDMDLREQIREYSWGAKKQLPTASHFVVILGRKANQMVKDSDYLKYISREIKEYTKEREEMRMNIFDNFQKNDFDLTDGRKIFDWVCRQTYIALGNMMTSAAQIGIDSCPIEGFDRQNVEDILSKSGAIDTDEFGVSVMVAFGYKKKDLDYPKSRRSMEEVTKWV